MFRDTLAGLQVEADAVRALAYRALAKQGTGRPNPELAMLPLVTARDRASASTSLGLEALGADGLDMGLDGPHGLAQRLVGQRVGRHDDHGHGGGRRARPVAGRVSACGSADRVAGRALGRARAGLGAPCGGRA